MANKNVLHGYRCPVCKSEGPFDVLATALFLGVTDEGTDEYCSVGWEDDSTFRCCLCSFQNKAYMFQEGRQIPVGDAPVKGRLVTPT